MPVKGEASSISKKTLNAAGPTHGRRREIESLFHLPSPFTRTPPATWHFWKILPPNSVALGLDFWAHAFYAVTMQKHDATMLNYDSVLLFHQSVELWHHNSSLFHHIASLWGFNAPLRLTMLKCVVIILNGDNGMINCDTTVWIMIPHGS